MANFNWAQAGGTTAAADDGLGTTINLSTGTEVNTSLKGASTSLGTTSTLQAAAVHGSFDSGLDAYCNFVNIGPAPDGQRTLSVTLSVGTLPTEDPNDAAYLLLLISPLADLQNVRGYAFGIARAYGGTNKSVGSLVRFGSNPSLGTVLEGTPVLATLTAVFQRDAEAARAAIGIARGNTSGFKEVTSNQDVVAETFTDVFIGIGLGQKAASPSTVVTWGDVKVTYSWT